MNPTGPHQSAELIAGEWIREALLLLPFRSGCAPLRSIGRLVDSCRRVGRIREFGIPASVWRACVRIPVFVRRLSRAVRHGVSLHGCGERTRHGSEPEDSGPSRLLRHPLVDCRSSSLDVARRSHRPSSRDPATQAPLTPGTKCRWRLHSAAATCDCPRCVIKVSRRGPTHLKKASHHRLGGPAGVDICAGSSSGSSAPLGAIAR